MANIVALEPCPFCGSSEVSIVGSVVRCGNCGAAGPFGDSVAETAQRWNGRGSGTSMSSGEDDSLDVRPGGEPEVTPKPPEQ